MISIEEARFLMEQALGDFPLEREEMVDAAMHFAEVVPWGKRWAAQIPEVIGPCLGDEWLVALQELRGRVAEDLAGVLGRIERAKRRREGQRAR